MSLYKFSLQMEDGTAEFSDWFHSLEACKMEARHQGRDFMLEADVWKYDLPRDVDFDDLEDDAVHVETVYIPGGIG